MAARGSVEKYSELAQHAHLKRRDPQQQRRRLLTVACRDRQERRPDGAAEGLVRARFPHRMAVQSWGPHCNIPVFGSSEVTVSS